MDTWTLMESDINSEVHWSPDDIPQKGCARTPASTSIALVYITEEESTSLLPWFPPVA